MRCPKCNGNTRILNQSTGLDLMRLECVMCGWTSETIEALLQAAKTPQQILLEKLKAEGAAPGWYGPDGRRLEVRTYAWRCWMGNGDWLCLESNTEQEMFDRARLCGCVEVEP